MSIVFAAVEIMSLPWKLARQGVCILPFPATTTCSLKFSVSEFINNNNVHIVRQPLNKKTKQDSMCRLSTKMAVGKRQWQLQFFWELRATKSNQYNQGSFQMMMLASYVVVIQHRLC